MDGLYGFLTALVTLATIIIKSLVDRRNRQKDREERIEQERRLSDQLAHNTEMSARAFREANQFNRKLSEVCSKLPTLQNVPEAERWVKIREALDAIEAMEQSRREQE